MSNFAPKAVVGVRAQRVKLLLALWIFVQSSCWAANYLEVQQTFDASDHRFPRINNNGEFVYSQQVSGQWQVFSSRRGQLTSAGSDYTDATSPAIADDGSFVCFRHKTSDGFGFVLRYPGPAIIEFSSRNSLSGDHRDAGEHPSMSSDGKSIWWYAFFGPSTTRRLFVSGLGQVSSGTYWSGDYPDVNAQGKFVFQIGTQIYLNNTIAFSGSYPHIGDAPQSNPDIVYVSGGQVRSTVMGIIGPGSWGDVNRDGIVVLERQTNGFYQIFLEYPLPKIVSHGATAAQVGLPYHYDSDNKAEAYAAPDYAGPYSGGPVTWSVVPNPNNPPGFSIDSQTGEVTWTPTTTGTYSVTIKAENGFGEDTENLTIIAADVAIELVDAMTFQQSGVLSLDPFAYLAAGQARTGSVADGVSKLVIRASLVGVDPTDTSLNLHFDLAGATKNGSLRAANSAQWALDVAAPPVGTGSPTKAICLYQAPLDFSDTVFPVTVRLLNGQSVITTKVIEVRRPPVVMVHGIWSSARQAWIESGVREYLESQIGPSQSGFATTMVDYESSNAEEFDYNVPWTYAGVSKAITSSRSLGYACSQADVVAHSMGGLLTRLMFQRHGQQGGNYLAGNIHKLNHNWRPSPRKLSCGPHCVAEKEAAEQIRYAEVNHGFPLG